MSVHETAPLGEVVVEYGFRPVYHISRAVIGMCLVALFGFYTVASALAIQKEYLAGVYSEAAVGVLLFLMAGGMTVYLAHTFFVASPRRSFSDN